jgi:D-alanyl-D-alanine carboxypeptidase
MGGVNESRHGRRRRRYLSLLAVASLAGVLLLLPGCGDDDDNGGGTTSAAAAPSGPLPQATQDKLDAAVQQSFKEAAAPGAIVGVQTPEGKWVKAVGISEDGTDKPMEPDMHVRIGSVTKTFTGTALMQLVGEGKISLEDPISKYVPNVPNGENITVLQVADMTSGIASYTREDSFTDVLFSKPETVWTPDQVLKIGLAVPPLFKPGTEFDYSNTNTVLIGLAIEKVTGQPLEDVFKDRILEPLGLDETSWPGDSPDIPEPFAHGYTLQGQPPGKPADATNWNPSWGWAAGELISSVDDLLVYGRALGTGKGLLSPALQNQRLHSMDREVPPLTATNRYGIQINGDVDWVGHVGTLPGYNTTVFYNPKIDTTVVVEANSDIARGSCESKDTLPTDTPEHQSLACADPATRIQAAVADVLGQPFELSPG